MSKIWKLSGHLSKYAGVYVISVICNAGCYILHIIKLHWINTSMLEYHQN